MLHLFARLAVAVLTFAVGLVLTFAAGLLTSALRGAPEPAEVPAPAVTTAVLVANPSCGKREGYSRDFGPQVVTGGVLDGKAMSKPAPEYPAVGKSVRAQGTVVVSVRVDEGGRVEAAWGVSGHPLLQQSAVEAAREARFAPTRLSGRPVKVAGTLSYDFVLD